MIKNLTRSSWNMYKKFHIFKINYIILELLYQLCAFFLCFCLFIFCFVLVFFSYNQHQYFMSNISCPFKLTSCYFMKKSRHLNFDNVWFFQCLHGVTCMHNFQLIRFLLKSLLVVNMLCYGYAKKNFCLVFVLVV